MSTTPGPRLGPCEPWIDGDAVAGCCELPASEGAEVFDDVAMQASMLLFEISGRRFTGGCEFIVRPCANPGSGCWDFVWSATFAWQGYWNASGYWWGSRDLRRSCGCTPIPELELAGYPVTEITEVLIDGAPIDPAEYELRGWKKLVRLDDPATGTRRWWPSCQNMAAPTSEAGTWQVTYLSGTPPPPAGVSAAAELACELWKACNGQTCRLPSRVTKIVRQGVTIERVTSLAKLLRSGATGLTMIDSFIAGYATDAPRRPPAIWSPDIAPFPARVQR